MRSGLLEARIPRLDQADIAHPQAEARLCWRRIRLLYWAIRFAVASALFISVVVICLFIGDFIDVDMGRWIALLFISAMSLTCAALLCLLVEVSISTNRLRQRLEHRITEADD